MWFFQQYQLLRKPVCITVVYLLMLFCVSAQARDVFTIEQLGSHGLAHGAYYLEDASGELNIQDAMTSDNGSVTIKTTLFLVIANPSTGYQKPYVLSNQIAGMS